MDSTSVSADPIWIRGRWQRKDRERNLPAAVLSIIVVATLATALAQPRWFYLKGGGCSQHFIGVRQFFSLGKFESLKLKSPSNLPSKITTASPSMLMYISGKVGIRDCFTPTIVSLLRINIALCIFAVLTSLYQFFMDSIGVKHRWMKIIRRDGLGSIISVLLCVTVIGLSYYVSTLVEHQQEASKTNPGTKIEVKFDIGYYLIAGAGAVAVIATAANMLRRYPPADSGSNENLLSDYDGNETFTVGGTQCQLWPCRRNSLSVESMPPPPPYSP